MLDREALRMIGVRDDDRVTLQAGPMPAGALLDALMRELASGLDQPVWEVKAGTILLTSDTGTEALRTLAVYDVRDLVSDQSLLADVRASRPMQGAEEPEDESATGATDSPAASFTPNAPAHELLLIILEHIDPDAWIDMGGTRATITDHNGLVIVSAPARLHRQFRDALRRLRRVQAVSVRMVVQVVDLPRDQFSQLNRQFPREGELVVAIMRSKEATICWQAQGTVAAGSALALRSSSEEREVSVDIQATYDRPSGRLQLTIAATMTNGSDRREARTDVAFQLGEGAAIIELAPAEPSSTARLVIVRPM
jgi:hypothetical protein